MMQKYVSRLLALILVLCLVVVCVPVRAYAEIPAKPDGYTEEEWLEYLRQMGLLETDTELTAESSVITITTTDDATGEESSAPAPADKAVEDQTVTVLVPVGEDAAVDGNTVVSEGTVPAPTEHEDDPPTEETVEATIEEAYEVDAEITNVEITDGEVTDITYDVSLNKTTTATDADNHTIGTPEVVEDVDVVQNPEAKASRQSAPQYNVNLSINGMDADKVTRVEHRYYTPKQPSADSEDSTPDEAEEHVEYYYNEANITGEREEGKKYFSIIETVIEGSAGVKQKAVSLWSSFLGIFNITTDAFEGPQKSDGTKDTYANLSDAARQNPDGTVEMMRDYETDSSASLDKSVTVDLNDHTYTSTGAGAAISSSGAKVTIQNGSILSSGDGAHVTAGKFSLRNIFLKSNKDKTATSDTAAIRAGSAVTSVTVKDDSVIDGSNSRYGIQYNGSSSAGNTLNLRDSSVMGGTGVAADNVSAYISDSYVAGTGKAERDSDSGAAVAAYGNTEVEISSGHFDSARWVENIYAGGSKAKITITGGRFSNSDDLYYYIPNNRALISHNDGSHFLYEVVGTAYTPSRDGYRFLGYTDGHGKAITLAQAAKEGIIAYAQWKAIPETTAKPVTVNDLIRAKTDERGCTTRITVKGDTAYLTVKDADGEYVPISEMTVSSIEKLQLLNIDTIEIQVDEDVTLVLDIEEAKKNGFEDTLEVTLEKDTLLITSGQETCIELDIAVLKASDKPVEIQLVEGELTVTLGKSSSLTVDLTKALKTGERIVVKLENGMLKLYDKYNKPIKEN